MRRCFLDIDGVLADWAGGVHRALGIPYDPRVWPYKKGPEGWHWHDEVGWTFNAVNQLCNYDFWENLNWTFDGHDILRVVLGFFDPEEITLLTAPMPNIMSASGKVAWVKKNLPTFESRMLVCTDKKAILAKLPGSVLIDDGGCNIRDWHAAGGRGVIVPRWWNDMHHRALEAPEFVNYLLHDVPNSGMAA